jgi:hypothetical protein
VDIWNTQNVDLELQQKHVLFEVMHCAIEIQPLFFFFLIMFDKKTEKGNNLKLNFMNTKKTYCIE